LEAYLADRGTSPDDVLTIYTPYGFFDWRGNVEKIKAFASEGKKTAVISTLDGDTNIHFYKELADQNVDAGTLPVMAFSVSERELLSVETKPLVGHLVAWNYFQSVKSPENDRFIQMWRDYTKNQNEITNDPMEATFIGFRMWVQAVAQAGTTDVNAVRQAMYGQRIKAPSGYDEVMNANHHLSKPAMIGKIEDSGRIDVIWRSTSSIRADAWSKYIPDSAKRTADWTFPWVCGGCTEPIFKDW
jgi:urea transport system substrate-binding protein